MSDGIIISSLTIIIIMTALTVSHLSKKPSLTDRPRAPARAAAAASTSTT